MAKSLIVTHSKHHRTTHNQKPVSEDNNGASMSKKCLGKQKAMRSKKMLRTTLTKFWYVYQQLTNISSLTPFDTRFFLLTV